MSRYAAMVSYLEGVSSATPESDVKDLAENLMRDLPVAMADLASQITDKTRDKVAWLQLVMQACFIVIRKTQG